MKITAIIVEDEAVSRDILRNYLGKYCPKVTLVGEASNIQEAYGLIQQHEIDLVFLDVEMPFGNAFKEYLLVKLAQNKESYRKKHFGLFERNILPKFSEYPIQEFKRQDLSSVVLPIQGSGR